MAEDTTLGPVTTPRGLEKGEALVSDAICKGAKPSLGTGQGLNAASGDKAISGGYFMAPSVLSGVTDDMLMSQEEIFAPVLGISVFDTEGEVATRANDTSMGLTSYVFTKNTNQLWRMFEKLEAGMVGLVVTGNNSSAETPFGGIKESGCGKESGKNVAIAEFMITKTGTFTVEEGS
ncbi:Fc.00g072820.m01.CDS01 [Cosmosporella sp. VM-42]